MNALPPYLTPERWLQTVFSAQEVARGGILKRKVRDIDRLCGRDLFLAEARRRGFQVLRNDSYFVVFCSQDPISRVI